MELINLLETGIPVFGKTFDVSLNWIGNLIRLLCGAVGTVGIGIILFSLILKLITLPFDVYQRISMRKQNQQMKANQERMEKLQKQYANNKEMYNQKLMEMYKENGISMFSSCLPMILSLVIFIIAINAFNAYAQYSNIENYNDMVKAYNQAMVQYCPDLTEENVDSSYDEESKTWTYTVSDDDADKYFYYKVKSNKEIKDEELLSFLNAYSDKAYYVDTAKVETNAEIMTVVNEAVSKTGKTKEAEIKNYFVSKAQDAVVVAYDTEIKNHTNFLWIKNIWATDASYKHPVLSYTDFKTEADRESFEVNGKEVKYSSISAYTNAYGEDEYNIVTEKLTGPKSEANGYFILIILSIGTILLQQFVMQRSQKDQQKFSSVDGQATSQQKMTMIIMTVMFAIFSFMYSSAFSIYMITSNLFSMLSTLVINKFVDMKLEKKEAQASVQKFKNHTQERIERAKNAGKESAEQSKNKDK